MNKHLLVAVSDAFTSSLSLRFVYEFFSNRKDLELTLYYVIPKKDPDGFSLASLPGAKRKASLDPDAIPAMEQARHWLLDMGFPGENIHAKVLPADLGVVKDIIRESEEGLYDAAVLGRRGLSWFEEVFSYSVTHRILWESITFPIWVCRNPDHGRKDVLVCVDGSEGCARVADHVGFMLRDEPGHRVTLLNVGCGEDSGDADIFKEPMRMLLDNGFPRNRVDSRCIPKGSPVKAILAESKNYAAVAIGRSAGRPTAFGQIFGSTSLKILRSMEGAALWLCK